MKKTNKADKNRYESRAKIAPDSVEIDDAMLEQINQYALKPLTTNDVYVRSMYIVNDQVDSYDSKFTHESLIQIAGMLPGESVLKGHDVRTLPVARFFKSTVTQKPGSDALWVRAWFYWVKGTAEADDLLRNIDGGVYREVSLCWLYNKSTCSICGADIWQCSHNPGDYYENELCYYEMSEIKEVLEGSFVYKGGQMGTELAGVREIGRAHV